MPLVQLEAGPLLRLKAVRLSGMVKKAEDQRKRRTHDPAVGDEGGCVVKILDLSAGNRAIWFNKDHPDACFLDCRSSVGPTVVCDTTKPLPSEIGNDFDLVVFDPPHVNFGKNSNMSRDYGHHTTEDIRRIVAESSKQAHAVSKDGAFMAFKWNDHDQALINILNLMAQWWEPLFGQISKTSPTTTHWVMLRRKNP